MDPQLQQFQKTAEELDLITKDLIKGVEEMKQNLKDISWHKWIRPTPEELIKQGHTWQQWYAWRPVKDIHGKWHWRKDVYRLLGNTYMDYDNANWYHYGTILDVLAST